MHNIDWAVSQFDKQVGRHYEKCAGHPNLQCEFAQTGAYEVGQMMDDMACLACFSDIQQKDA